MIKKLEPPRQGIIVYMIEEFPDSYMLVQGDSDTTGVITHVSDDYIELAKLLDRIEGVDPMIVRGCNLLPTLGGLLC